MAEIDYRALLLRDEDEKQKPPIEKEVDDGVDYRALLGGDSPTITQQGYTPFGRIQENMEWDKLHEQDAWIKASQHFFNMTYGYVPQIGDSELEGYSGTSYREKLADYGLKQMAGFNFNLGDMAIDTTRVLQADQETKEAFVYMLDQYDATNTSWHTASQAGWEMFTDVTNWAGLYTLGATALAGQVGRLVGKQGLKEAIKASMKNATQKSIDAAAKVGINTSVKRAGAVVGVEGMGHAMAADSMEQHVRIDSGQQDEYSYGRTALMGGIGFGTGVILGSGLDYGVSKVMNKYYSPKVTKAEKRLKDAEIQAQLIAEQRLAEAKAEAGTITKAVDDGLPPNDVNKIISDSQKKADAETLNTEEPDVKPKGDSSDPRPPKAKLFKHMFKHAYNIFEDVQKNPEGAVQRVIDAFETDRYTPVEYRDILKQLNAAAELARYDVQRLNGIMMKDTLSIAERSVLKGDIRSAVRASEQLRIIKEYGNSYSGRNLKEIQEFMTYKQNLSTQEGKKFNYEKAVKASAKKVYNKKLAKLLDEHDQLINKAIKEGKDKEARELRDAKVADVNGGEIRKQMDEMVKLKIDDVITQKPKSKWDDKFLEASISGVFSIPTLIYNTVFPAMKVSFYPMLDTIINNPLNRMAWRKNLMVYAEMKGSLEAAWVSARAAARYEQTFLTADMSRILEGGVKIDRLLGSQEAARFLRIFPRLVSASDAFQQEMAAVSKLTAKGFDRLIDEGTEQGLSGKALHKFIDDNIQTEINKGYDFTVTLDKMKPIYELGTRKGLAGKALEDFVDAEVDKLGAGAFKTLGDDVTVADMRKEVSRLLGEGTEESHNLAEVLAKQADEIEETGMEALEEVRTLLYKRDFDRDGSFPERVAAGYESFTRDKAWTRALGNLFFRTPAWLFHESMRLTPAVNQLLPTFRNDLAGVNGIQKQTRAKTEAAVGYAWMLYVITKYAEGEISGSANVDYTKTGEKNKSSMRPLTIKDPFFFDGGKEVSFARWEPLRIPTTMVVNALDGYMNYQEKLSNDGVDPSQEGFIPDEVMAGFGVAFATAISAFRDSALTQGVTDTVGTAVKVAGFMESPEGEDKERGMKLLGNFFIDKSLQVVPSSLRKGHEAYKGDAPVIQPNTALDKVIASFNPYHSTIPRRYDALGFPMEREVTYTQITGFGAAYPEDLANGRSERHMEVLDYLAKLEDLNFGNFTRQKTRDDRFPNQDLRALDVNYEGQTISLFDAMMQELGKDETLLESLHYYANANHMDLGSPLNQYTIGKRVKKTKERLTEARSKALDNVIRKNATLTKEVRSRQQFQKLLQGGVSTNRGNVPLNIQDK